VETEVLPLLLQINLKNYYGAIAPTLINNLNFEGENSYGTLI
jgi:hypothetical protein